MNWVVLRIFHLYFDFRFAELSAAVFLTSEVPVYLFSDLVPTPFVPFGINLFHVAVGIMVTASHNPKEDNGYKVYWENAAQVCKSFYDEKRKNCGVGISIANIV